MKITRHTQHSSDYAGWIKSHFFVYRNVENTLCSCFRKLEEFFPPRD